MHLHCCCIYGWLKLNKRHFCQLNKKIEKTKNMQILSNKYKIEKYILKLRIPVLLIVVILIVPAFLAQSETNFLYGTGDNPEESRAGQDEKSIEDAFGKYTPMVLL